MKNVIINISMKKLLTTLIFCLCANLILAQTISGPVTVNTTQPIVINAPAPAPTPATLKLETVHITTRPEPVTILLPVLRTKSIGLTSVQVCNEGVNAINIPTEQIVASMPDFPYLSSDQAALLVNQSYQSNPKLKWIKIGGYVLLAAAALVTGSNALNGTVQISPKTISAISVGLPVLDQIGKSVQGEVPSISQFSPQLLAGTFSLTPAGQVGYCTTKIMFGTLVGKTPTPFKAYDLTLQLPYNYVAIN